jgi:two-component system, cell cycle response regulator DivK
MAGGRILVAEDNDKSLKLFRDVLQVSGFETLVATTGEQAVELAAEWDPDLILMDIRLAGIDGVAALNRLREDQRTAATPVVALTAQAMAGDRERFLEAGFDDYISKPVDVHAFLAVVRRYAEARRDG